MTALLHYWLTKWRGGEKVLAALNELYPEADIFTHAISGELRRHFPKKVFESHVASLPFGRVMPQMYLPLMPSASRAFDMSEYDLIISSESGPIKGIVKPSGARHICYCHTPMRYVWDLYDEYYRQAGAIGKLAMSLFTPYLRKEDLRSAESVDEFVANSKFVANRIRKIYGREAKVVHPPVDVDFFHGEYEKKNYYLFAGANVPYKRLDLAREACRRMGRELKVVGGGMSDDEFRRAYGEARALIFPGIEDFGIVPVEAQAAGTPVVAFGLGGALETVSEGETGMFFREHSAESLMNAIEEFEGRKWDSAACVRHAELFRKERFVAGMREVIGR